MTGQAGPRGMVLGLLGVPLLLALAEAIAFHVDNRNDHELFSSGERREYRLHVPERHPKGEPAALVISLHGAGGWPAQQQEISRWNDVADEHGFLLAYPAASEGNANSWRLSDEARLARDVRFVADLIEAVSGGHAVDPTRVYASGLSAGGGMAEALSCRLRERIAAIGTVAAARVVPWSRCPDPRPMPMITFHGTDDTIVPYRGGRTWIGDVEFPDVEEWTTLWAGRNRCSAEWVDVAVAPDARRRDYVACAGAPVVLFTLRGGGHTWPGGAPLPRWFLGETKQSVDATRETWAFFERHRGGGRQL